MIDLIKQKKDAKLKQVKTLALIRGFIFSKKNLRNYEKIKNKIKLC